jgi:CubicO group peptidase (beta-lactamase class C family)
MKQRASRTALRDLVGKGVLQLEAEGRLSLDDTVERWLPGPGAGQRLRR